MTLATRCPACGTAFRVVSDQLRVSSGWVRCGRCGASFDALEHLFRHASSRQGTPPAAPAPATPAPAADPLPTAPDAAATAPPDAVTPLELDLDLSAAPESTQVPMGLPDEPAPIEPDEPVASASDEPALPGSDAPANPAADAPAETDGDPLESPEPASVVSPEVETNAVPAAATSAAPVDFGGVRQPGFRPRGRPAFLRRAEAAARWSHPATRTTLALLLVILGLLLTAQATLLWRDEIALRWPATRATLEAACAGLGCRIDAPRRIQSLAVESSDLRSEPDGATYRLEVAIRNRGPIELLAPAIELTLTDAAGQLIARRVLTPAELGSPARPIPAGEERVVQAELVAGPPAVAGYTISLFYP